jgi:hypothetical protein
VEGGKFDVASNPKPRAFRFSHWRRQGINAKRGACFLAHLTQERIQEEIDSIKQCLAICAEASVQAGQDRTNIFEDVSMTDDGRQAIVSTIGDLVSAKRITAGARSMQLMGQMSDESLQHFSRDRYHATEEKGPKTGGGFEDRHGARWTLTSQKP